MCERVQGHARRGKGMLGLVRMCEDIEGVHEHTRLCETLQGHVKAYKGL